MLRTIVERSTRNLVFRRRLPRAVGGSQIYVSSAAGLRYLLRPMHQIDPELCNLAKEFVHKGSVVWDIGANVGLFSSVAAHLSGPTGRTISFEPDIWLAQLLRRSCSLQPASSAPVQVIPVAVAESVAETVQYRLPLQIVEFSAGYGLTQAE